MKILTITINPAVDASTSTQALTPSRKLRCNPPMYNPGGGGINVSRVAQRFGIESTALICSGGATGAMLEDLLAKEQITPRVIPISGFTRENFAVSVTSSKEHYQFIMPGPSLLEKEWQALLAEVSLLSKSIPYTVASGSLPLGVPEDFYARIATIVNKNGGRLVVDTSGDALKAALQEKVFMIKPSLREVKQLLNIDEHSGSDPVELSRELSQRADCELVVVSMGAAGAIGTWETGGIKLTPPHVSPQSVVGAGDSMVAGTLIGLIRNWAYEDALALGVAAGTAAVLGEGTGLASRKETEDLYPKIIREHLSITGKR